MAFRLLKLQRECCGTVGGWKCNDKRTPPQDTSRFSRLLLQPTFHLLFVVQLLFGTSIIWQILQEWQTIYLQTLSN